jgi:predicted metal-dependent phosphotriesterase family hydrolase
LTRAIKKFKTVSKTFQKVVLKYWHIQMEKRNRTSTPISYHTQTLT